MQTTTLSFQNMHAHGALFTDVLKARRETFIVQREWDLPEVDGMEFDQYDTPQSRWIAVHHLGRVLAGIRMTPTTARCGISSYMIRDAQLGLLDSIPQDLLFDPAPINPHIWETSRVFVTSEVPAKARVQVQASLMAEMVRTAREEGATQLLGLCPRAWMRWMRRLGYSTEHVGPCLDIGGSDNQAILMRLNSNLH
ncbi:MAG: N-acyl-L-homoserine lactone synthetase [Alphaproteobacteria bacterium]|nr:N-acyl-L-homoserine lactone synthetase [Alphaproteobacteria bacterium]NNF25369.1 N-acyl-L-homoserine lactone synthetase [Paracoccaceae bacterium]